jgi:predicted tellurium resistance membrane protein TerC
VCAGGLLARLLVRWRAVTNGASALLALIGADMIMTDPALSMMDVGLRQRWVVEGVAAAGILVVGMRLQMRREPSSDTGSSATRNSRSRRPARRRHV